MGADQRPSSFGAWWRLRTRQDAEAFLNRRLEHNERQQRHWSHAGRPNRRDWLLFAGLAGAVVVVGRSLGLF